MMPETQGRLRMMDEIIILGVVLMCRMITWRH